MGAKHAPRAQLRLIPPTRTVEIPPEIERRLIDALADLLVQVATSEGSRTKGGSDEREDSR
jgi:hypothetical protein